MCQKINTTTYIGDVFMCAGGISKYFFYFLQPGILAMQSFKKKDSLSLPLVAFRIGQYKILYIVDISFWNETLSDFGRIEVIQENQILKAQKGIAIFSRSTFHLFTETEITWWQPSFLFSGRFSGSEVQSAESSQFITASQAGQRNPGDYEVLISRPAKRAVDRTKLSSYLAIQNLFLFTAIFVSNVDLY